MHKITKSIPSMVLNMAEHGHPGSQKVLMKLFRDSMAKSKEGWAIADETAFKYALGRLNPRRDVLKRIAPFLPHRPDLSVTFSQYLKKFACSKEVADLLLETLERDPTYDAAAANYIAARDCCEPDDGHAPYRSVVNTARKRSEENSILIRIAVLKFRGRRKGPKDAMALIQKEKDPRVRNIVIDAHFGPRDDAPYKLSDCRELLEREVDGPDEELARYCGLLLIFDAIHRNISWAPGKAANSSVKLLVKGLGLRARMPKRQSVLDGFFEKAGVKKAFPWRKALGKNLSDAEHRCLRLIQLEVGDPTARILMLDTFNEVLIQAFSESDPMLAPAYRRAAGKHRHPDYGNWITNGSFTSQLPTCASRLQQIHASRVRGDLAHAKSRQGKATKPISYNEARKLMVVARSAWIDLVAEWRKIL